MRTAGMFVDELVAGDLVDHVADVRVDLYGSLTATGAGHGTLSAILLGLEGDRPETIETDEVERRLAVMRADGKIRLAGRIVIALTESDIALHPFRQLDHHPNAMTLTATSVQGQDVCRETYYSVGGGFVVTEADSKGPESGQPGDDKGFRGFRGAQPRADLRSDWRVGADPCIERNAISAGRRSTPHAWRCVATAPIGSA
jgi:L-serine dehydratase